MQGYAKAAYYYQLVPQRLLDTRFGLGAPTGIVPAGGVVHLQVTGRGGVPAANVTAVVLNMTVTGPTGAGHLTVYPAGVAQPNASALNFVKNWTGANSVTVKLGAGGVVDIYSSGTTHIIADVLGFYTGATAAVQSLGIGGQYHMVQPTRLLDTRFDPSVKRVPAFGAVTFGIDFGSAVSSHVRAVAVNITAVSPGTAGYLTAWSGVGSMPNTSTLNFTAGKIVPNMALVPTGPCWLSGCGGLPQIQVYNGSSSGVDVIVDIVGYFDDGTVANGLLFRARTPVRLLDTRGYYNGSGPRPVGPGATVPVIPRNVLSNWSDYSHAVVMNVTGVSPTADTYLTLWPDGLARPTVSNLNPATGQIVANASITGIGGVITGFRVFNNAGYTDVVLDVVGTFEPPGSPNPLFALTGPPNKPSATTSETTTVTTRAAVVSG